MAAPEHDFWAGISLAGSVSSQPLKTRRALQEPTEPSETTAAAALAQAERWIRTRPPTGVSDQFSWSFPFDRQTPQESFRFDIENIVGHNLRNQA